MGINAYGSGADGAVINAALAFTEMALGASWGVKPAHPASDADIATAAKRNLTRSREAKAGDSCVFNSCLTILDPAVQTGLLAAVSTLKKWESPFDFIDLLL
jgi:hypothetical protein